MFFNDDNNELSYFNFYYEIYFIYLFIRFMFFKICFKKDTDFAILIVVLLKMEGDGFLVN